MSPIQSYICSCRDNRIRRNFRPGDRATRSARSIFFVSAGWRRVPCVTTAHTRGWRRLNNNIIKITQCVEKPTCREGDMPLVLMTMTARLSPLSPSGIQPGVGGCITWRPWRHREVMKSSSEAYACPSAPNPAAVARRPSASACVPVNQPYMSIA